MINGKPYRFYLLILSVVFLGSFSCLADNDISGVWHGSFYVNETKVYAEAIAKKDTLIIHFVTVQGLKHDTIALSKIKDCNESATPNSASVIKCVKLKNDSLLTQLEINNERYDLSFSQGELPSLQFTELLQDIDTSRVEIDLPESTSSSATYYPITFFDKKLYYVISNFAPVLSKNLFQLNGKVFHSFIQLREEIFYNNDFTRLALAIDSNFKMGEIDSLFMVLRLSNVKITSLMLKSSDRFQPYKGYRIILPTIYRPSIDYYIELGIDSSFLNKEYKTVPPLPLRMKHSSWLFNKPEYQHVSEWTNILIKDNKIFLDNYLISLSSLKEKFGSGLSKNAEKTYCLIQYDDNSQYSSILQVLDAINTAYDEHLAARIKNKHGENDFSMEKFYLFKLLYPHPLEVSLCSYNERIAIYNWQKHNELPSSTY